MYLNYHHLRYFWAVAHDGNLTRVARNLAVSQSALSVQIRALADQLGHPLFERRGKRLELTEAGRVTLEFADGIFTRGEELMATMRALDDVPRRVFRVGSLATLSRNFQLEFLGPLLARDDVEVVIRSGRLGDLLQHLEDYRLDVVLCDVAPPRDAATKWVLHRIDDQPVSLVGHPSRRRRPRDVKTLLATESLVLPTQESSIRIGFDALTHRLGVHPRIVAEVDDMAMLRLVARNHTGLALVPPIVVRDELDAGVLREVARLPELAETFFAITLARRFPNSLLDVVLPHAQAGRPRRRS